MPPPGLSLPVIVCCPLVFGWTLRNAGASLHRFNGPGFKYAFGCSRPPLKHFTPWPTQNSAGVNVFSQTLHRLDKAYVFPPLALTGILLRFLDSQPSPFTIVVPDPFPRRYWWPVISGRAQDFVRLGALGDHNVLLFPRQQE